MKTENLCAVCEICHYFAIKLVIYNVTAELVTKILVRISPSLKNKLAALNYILTIISSLIKNKTYTSTEIAMLFYETLHVLDIYHSLITHPWS
jgi:hypothetical protein